jgi:hypothetical protein
MQNKRHENDGQQQDHREPKERFGGGERQAHMAVRR